MEKRKKAEKDIIPIGLIEEQIFTIRDKRVVMDADLAKLYGVTTKRLHEQVRRKADRFPGDFSFVLKKRGT